MSAICDERMSKFAREGIPPHIAVFGPNGTRWRQCQCAHCLSEDVACVDRPDFSARDGVAHWERQP